MQRIMAGTMRAAALLAVTLSLAACGIESQEAPSLIGPSGFGQSVTLSAVPDRLPRDGRSQSVVTLTVRNASGEAVSGQRVTLDSNVGILTQADVVTGRDGRASFTVVAPPPGSTGNTIEVFATPVGGNFDDAVTRSLTIAVTGPSNSAAPTPQFTINSAAGTAPVTVEVLSTVVFDASPTTDEGQPCLERCSYAWDFGGEASASGRLVTYQFRQAATYAVRLTVTDASGTSASVTRTIVVEVGESPDAEFTFSPTDPEFDEPVFFDAGLSAPAAGNASRSPIVEYIWTFGDSADVERTSSRIVQHTFRRPASGAARRTFRVVLTVVDTAGRRASVAEEITVGDPPEDEPAPDGSATTTAR
jgi:hypothetical protein